jgi:hypothetical protein
MKEQSLGGTQPPPPLRVVGSQNIDWQSINSKGAVVVVLVALAIATDLT